MNDDIINQLIEEHGEEFIKQMADMTRLHSVLDAVVFTGSTNYDVLAEWIYNNKERHIPLDLCRTVVGDYYPRLVEDGMIVDGKPTEEAIFFATEHQALLNSDQALNA